MTVSNRQKEIRCANCGALGIGRFCGECGAPRAESGNPYLLVADSFFKFSELKRYIFLYRKILASPTKGTIETFEAGHLIDGGRFLEYGAGLYTLALGISGFALVRGSELVKTITQPIWLFIGWSVTYTLYYLAMRNKGTQRRTIREFLLFCCLTVGFTLPVNIIQVFGIVGGLVTLVLQIPLMIYMVRTWKYFWGASSGRVFWSLFGCTIIGVLVGALLLIPIWMAFGVPPSFSVPQ